jgi:hypothetical protein
MQVQIFEPSMQQVGAVPRAVGQGECRKGRSLTTGQQAPTDSGTIVIISAELVHAVHAVQHNQYGTISRFMNHRVGSFCKGPKGLLQRANSNSNICMQIAQFAWELCVVAFTCGVGSIAKGREITRILRLVLRRSTSLY